MNAVNEYWPLFDLRITTPRLELRYPDDELVSRLAVLAAEGIHPPDTMPFRVPWTRQPVGVLQLEAMKHFWRQRSALSPVDWHVPFAALSDGELVGVQECFAVKFPTIRTVQTGSWIGLAHQGRGIGKEMRAAVLHLAFDGLGAIRAETGAWEDNTASIAVTRSQGYVENGDEHLDREGHPTRMIRFRLTREDWTRHRRSNIVVHNLDPCLELLGIEQHQSNDS